MESTRPELWICGHTHYNMDFIFGEAIRRAEPSADAAGSHHGVQRSRNGAVLHRLATLRAPEGREALVLDWSRARGRVSSTEVADLTGLSKVSAGKLLTRLEAAGHLKAGRSRRRGRGFFYVPAEPGE